MPIVDEIERRTGRSAAPAAVYVTLRRLEEKGCSLEDERPAAERGGKARRCVKVTRAGPRAARGAPGDRQHVEGWIPAFGRTVMTRAPPPRSARWMRRQSCRRVRAREAA